MPNTIPDDSQRDDDEDLSLPNSRPQLGRDGAFTRRALTDQAHEEPPEDKEEELGEDESPSRGM